MKQLKDINWNHLYYFYETARLHSIKKVSELTKLSPSTISEQIKRLESDLDSQLFKRSRAGFILTQNGESLFKHAKKIFEEGYKVLEQFSTDEIGGYPVTIGVDHAILSPVSTRVISQYWDLYTPFGMVNTLKQGDHDILIQNIIQDNIDWGLSLNPSKRKTLSSVQVDEYDLQLCCAKHIVERFKKKEQIPQYLPLMETAINHPFKAKLDQHIRSSGLLFNETCYTDNYDYLIHLLLNGRALSYLPASIIKQHKGLRSLFPDKSIRVPIYAIWKIKNEKLISVSTIKSMAEQPNQPTPSIYYQLEVSQVPKEALRTRERK